GVEVLGEREIQHEVQRVAAVRQLGDRALLELLVARLDDLHLVPFAVEQAKVRRAGDFLAQGVPERFLSEFLLEQIPLERQSRLPALEALEYVRRAQG